MSYQKKKVYIKTECGVRQDHLPKCYTAICIQTHLRCDVPLGLTDQTVLPVLLQQLLALRRLLDLHVLFLCGPYLLSNVL